VVRGTERRAGGRSFPGRAALRSFFDHSHFALRLRRGAGGPSISLISTSGTGAGNFAETNNCGKSVAGHGNCTINVTFKPHGDRGAIGVGERYRQALQTSFTDRLYRQ
jgi:hypothetical protein